MDLIDKGAQPRPEKPAGYYSKAAIQERRALRAERAAAAAARAADRAADLRLIEARTAPLRQSAARRLAELRTAPPAPAPIAAKSKRPKRDRRPELLRAFETRAEANRLDWARRHPKAAAAERNLRKERVSLLERWKHKREGTPETHEYVSRQEGALARLFRSGAIDREQLAAAVEIALVAERIGADVAVRTASLETRIDMTRTGDGTFFEKLGQVRREAAYTRWRSEVQGPIGAVLDMICGAGRGGEPIGFTIVAKRYRIHNRKAKRLLVDALNLWPRILGEVCKEVDAATLAAAHAGILS